MSSLARRKLSKRGTSPTSPDDGESLHSNKRPKILIDLTSPLCGVCQQLDLDAKVEKALEAYQQARDGLRSFPKDIYKASDGSWFYGDAILAHQFNDSLSKPSDCPLCEFFRSLRIQPDRHKSYKLLAFRGSDSWLFKANWLQNGENENFKECKDSVFMAVVPDLETIPQCGYEESWLDHDIPATGAIYCLRPGDNSRSAEEKYILRARELGDMPKLDVVQEWLEACRQNHGSYCKQRASDESISRGFRVIDCTKEPPFIEEKPWGTTYAALSYVWGSTPEDLKDWPETVLDAVEVTKKLGLQYLWVDRLCIN